VPSKDRARCALDLFESPPAFSRARCRRRPLRFSTAFGAPSTTYTGFVFELHDPAPHANVRWWQAEPMTPCRAARQRAGDPAVGFAVWIERLAPCGRIMSSTFVSPCRPMVALQGNAKASSRAPGSARQRARARLSRHDRRSPRVEVLSLGGRDRRAAGAGRVHVG